MNVRNLGGGYVVWRRHPDGFVGASHGMLPFGYHTTHGSEISFEEIARTPELEIAMAIVASEGKMKPAEPCEDSK